MAKKKRRGRVNLEQAIAMYQSGDFTLQEIGDVQEVTFQAVHAALVRHGVITPRKKPDMEKVKAILREIEQRMPAAEWKQKRGKEKPRPEVKKKEGPSEDSPE